jgi:hypothetical protein
LSAEWKTTISSLFPKYKANGKDVDYQRGIINVELQVSTPEQTVKPIKVEAVLTVRGRGEGKT